MQYLKMTFDELLRHQFENKGICDVCLKHKATKLTSGQPTDRDTSYYISVCKECYNKNHVPGVGKKVVK